MPSHNGSGRGLRCRRHLHSGPMNHCSPCARWRIISDELQRCRIGSLHCPDLPAVSADGGARLAPHSRLDARPAGVCSAGTFQDVGRDACQQSASRSGRLLRDPLLAPTQAGLRFASARKQSAAEPTPPLFSCVVSNHPHAVCCAVAPDRIGPP